MCLQYPRPCYYCRQLRVRVPSTTVELKLITRNSEPMSNHDSWPMSNDYYYSQVEDFMISVIISDSSLTGTKEVVTSQGCAHGFSAIPS